MASWGSFAFFPITFETAGAGRSYATEHTQNDNADFFDARQENGLWRFNLSGLKILASNVDEWDAFHDYIKGQWKPFLFRLNSRRFEILKDQPGGIGTGNGTSTQFQLVKTRSYPYAPTNISNEVIRFPHHLYPQMRVRLGNAEKGPIIYPEDEKVRIWVGGIEKASGWAVNRETGLVTFTQPPLPGALIQAACRHHILVHGQDLFLLQNEGGHYVFSEGASLFQVASER
jgi:hypothetical protein